QRVGISLVFEATVAGRHPPRVFAQNPAAARAIHGDRAHHLDPPWIQDALHLDHLVRGAADKDIEARFDDRRADGFRITPVAQQARAVAGELVTTQGDSVALERAEVAAETRVDVLAQHALGVLVVVDEVDAAGKRFIANARIVVRRPRDGKLQT